MWFSCLLWRSTNVCDLSAAHKNAAVPSGRAVWLHTEAVARVGQYYLSVLLKAGGFGLCPDFQQKKICIPKKKKITKYFSLLEANNNRIN